MGTCSFLFKVDLGQALDLGYKIMVWNEVFQYGRGFHIQEWAKDPSDLAVLIGAGFKRSPEQTPDQFIAWCLRNAEAIWNWAGSDRLLFDNEYSEIEWMPEMAQKHVPDAKFLSGRYTITLNLSDAVGFP